MFAVIMSYLTFLIGGVVSGVDTKEVIDASDDSSGPRLPFGLGGGGGLLASPDRSLLFITLLISAATTIRSDC